MLASFIRKGLGGLRQALVPGRGRIVFVCATTLEPDAFWSSSSTGPAIRHLMEHLPDVECRVSFNNRQGLPVIYNAAIAAARASDILVFLHDDVWLPLEPLQTVPEALRNGLSQFDVIGVVGWIPDDSAGEAATAVFSGEIVEGTPEQGTHRIFNPAPAACTLLDGVFMAARAGCLRKAGVRFDEHFDFHHYDLDFCRTAGRAGLRLGTWPLLIIHRSSGDFAGEVFARGQAKYREKWGNLAGSTTVLPA